MQQCVAYHCAVLLTASFQCWKCAQTMLLLLVVVMVKTVILGAQVLGLSILDLECLFRHRHTCMHAHKRILRHNYMAGNEVTMKFVWISRTIWGLKHTTITVMMVVGVIWCHTSVATLTTRWMCQHNAETALH